MSVTVNASTSVVLVETSKVTDNFIVYFPSYFSGDQIITIRDQDGFASPDTPIILSSFNGTVFQPEQSELVIDEPYGFFTIKNISTGLFETINSFNIPAEFATANTSNLLTNDVLGLTTLTLIDVNDQIESAIYSSNDFIYLDDSQLGNINNEILVSTVDSLGSLGYISSFSYDLILQSLETYTLTGKTVSSINFANIQYSYNGGQSWANGLGTTGFAQYGTALTYSDDDNIFVAAGQNDTGTSNLGYLQWSSNSIDWYPSESPTLDMTQTRSAVHYANSLYHAVGSNGSNGGANTILYSDDGKNWQPSEGSPFTNGFATGITYGNGVWVVTGCTPSSSAACALWSSDGSNWSSAATTAWNGKALYDVIFTNNRFVAICTSGSNSSTSNVCFSLDGSNWFSSNAYGANFRNNAQYITGSETQIIATTFNTNQKLVYSLDGGETWNSNTALSAASAQIYKPYYDGVKWLASVGNNIRQTWVSVGEGTNTIASSVDGSNWTGFGTSIFSTKGNAVGWNGLLFVAVGQGGNSIATSTDGYTWTGLGTSIFSAGYGIGWNGSEFVAVGSGTNTIAVSSDGVNWAGIGDPIGGSITSGCVAFNGRVWVVGSTGNNKLVISSEGFNWSNATGTTFNNGCYGIAWNGQLFVAVGGNSGTTIAYSSNGSNWYPGTGTLFGARGNGVAWNGSIWIAVGTDPTNNILASSDGINWGDIGNPSPSPFTNAVNSIAWNGSQWIATGQGGFVIATSTDGSNWSGISDTSLYTTAGIGISYSYPINRNPLWVATGRGTNTIAVSFDGSNWRGLGTSIFSTAGYNIFWSRYMYVAVGEGTNTIATSLDGISWTGLGNTIFSTRGRAIAWNGSLWIAGGIGTNTIATSEDGTIWTPRTNSFTECYNVAWNGDTWIAVGRNGVNGEIEKSANGISWSSQTAPFSSGVVSGIAWNGIQGLWVVVGSGTSDTIATSSNGTLWTGLGKTIFTTSGNAVAWNGSLWVAVGQGTNTVATSLDGSNWVGRGNPFGNGVTAGYGISWSGKYWIALGDGPNSISISSDGIFWTGLTEKTIFSTYGLGATYTRLNLPPIWVLGGNIEGTNILSTSIDGSNFTGRSGPLNESVWQSGWNGNYWLATGGGTNDSLMYSVNGIDWYRRLLKDIFPAVTTSVAWNGKLWVVMGEGTSVILATSTDGIFWTPRTIPFGGARKVFWDGSRWFACGSLGSPTACVSSDGIVWTGIQTFLTTSTDQIAYNGSLYVAVGQGSSHNIATSVDGITWVGRGKPVLTNVVKGVTWGKNRWVAVGQGGSGQRIASSTDGISWSSNAGAALFNNFGQCIATNGNVFVAGGYNFSGPNTVAYSTDGINWTGNLFGNIGAAQGVAYGGYISNPVVPAGAYYTTDLVNWTPMTSNPLITNGGVITAFTSRKTDDNINLLYQSSLLGIKTVFTASTINVNYISSAIITSRNAFISSLFVNVQNVSTTTELSSVTSTLNVNNSVVTFASIGSAFIQYASINSINAGTIVTNVIFASTLNVQNLRLSTFSTAALVLNSSTISIGSNTGPAINFGRINPQGDNIGLGTLAGNFNARSNTIAIGYRAGFSNASTGAISIGLNAGSNTIGNYSIGIGPNAGSNFLSANTILINASNQGIGSTSDNGFFVNPIGLLSGGDTNRRQLYYNTTNYEITYGPLSFLSSFSTVYTSTVGINGGVADTVNFQVNGSANIESASRNFRFGVSSVNQGVSFDYNAINVGRRNTEIMSGRGAGSKGWIDFYTGVGDDATPTGDNLAFTIANGRVGVNVSSPQVTMDIRGRLRAFSSINTCNAIISSINGLPVQTASSSSFGSNVSLSTLTVANDSFSSNYSFVNNISTNSLITNSQVLSSVTSTILINRPTTQMWVAVGVDGTNSIKYSYNGINWNNGTNMFTVTGLGIAWNGYMWVACGQGGATMKYSYNGINWNDASTGGGGMFNVSGRGIAWNGSMWVAVGNDGMSSGNTIKYSYDGINWTNASSGMFGSSYQGNGVAWNGNMWVAVGVDINTIKYSYDGLNWNNVASGKFAISGNSVAWNGYMWVAVGLGGGNTIKYSYDGINWTNASSGMFSSTGYGVAWNGFMWIALGSDSSGYNIKYSYNGINWTNAGGVGGIGYGAAWNGNMWVAVGSFPVSIKYSYNGIDWNDASTGGTFFTRGEKVAYSTTIQPDISTSNLNFYLQSQPTYINTKNQVLTTASTIVLNNTLYIDRSISSVGVNIGKADYNLHVVGNMRCSSTLIGGLGIMSNTTDLATSDSNIKENIQFADLNRCMEIVETVPLKHYRFIPEYQQAMFDKSQIGFLAQDVEQVFPHTTVTLYNDTINRDIKYLSKDQMYMAHFGTTQKLIQFIELQTSQISTLYSRIDALENIISTVNYSA